LFPITKGCVVPAFDVIYIQVSMIYDFGFA